MTADDTNRVEVASCHDRAAIVRELLQFQEVLDVVNHSGVVGFEPDSLEVSKAYADGLLGCDVSTVSVVRLVPGVVGGLRAYVPLALLKSMVRVSDDTPKDAL
ncbi:hypothetical protein [Nocardia sp. NBC_01327]|uniref:hypothetical protein n=1 Tax=Nocardia sp. NBC_01327 TaxID=2903593 RepID=UPI002E165008|nr:hypothetical protein OG326_23740 [Nocardia sp. NBC_01327]